MTSHFEEIKNYCNKNGVQLIAVSKTKPVEDIEQLYNQGQIAFGENKVQELLSKKITLPSNIQWHFIGHLQTNKVKSLVGQVQLIHSVDSLKLLKEINKQAFALQHTVHCLFQIFIASEETKFGLTAAELVELIGSNEFKSMKNISMDGLMGMASNTENEKQIRIEFSALKKLYDQIKNTAYPNCNFNTLSMGMSSDYKIAVEEGSNMIRVGSALFGSRN